MSILLALALAGVAAPAPTPQPDAVVGRWKTETKNGVVEIARCGASICGRLVTSDLLRTNPGLKDGRNSNPALRNRLLRGLLILGGFTPAAGGVWEGGTIYNGDDGKTYSARVTPISANQLKVRGCVFVPFCKTQTWTRVN
ncbi:DUF2147 domain-containing protein [Sphingomonas oligophenolica]|uniref:DUF2147 domain-containing protein n=1 Tax=Sphingomonas oligophenolica TaxID=301154 RepID=A0ABU9YA36_9SPHN